jgi:hypothetical protein
MNSIPGRPAPPRRPLTGPLAISAAAVLVLSGALQSPAFAGKLVGPNDCMSCHDHDAASASLKKHPHWRSLDVFEGKKAKEFLTKLGIKDPYSDFCTGCHATVVDGSPDFGVSCESCHGGASDYLKPHQKKGSYDQALSLGMLKTKDIGVRVKNCIGCHIVTKKQILEVGHPNGGSFDIVEGCKKVQHWQETASADQILAAWKSGVAAAGGVVSASLPSAPTPAPSAPPAAATPSKPAASAPSSAPTPVPPAANQVKPAAAPGGKAPSISLPPDESWPSDLPALDSVASLQARLILVLDKLLAESGAAGADGGSLEPPAPGASSPEARLIDLQRRVLALQRKLLASTGK